MPSPNRIDPPDDSMPVLLYDAECGLCDRCVRWLLRRDRFGRLHFTGLQSTSGQYFLRGRRLPTTDFESAVFVSDWRRRETTTLLFRTDAILAAASVAGLPGWLIVLLRFIPRWLRDALYRIVARGRHRFFGSVSGELSQRPEWSNRFIG